MKGKVLVLYGFFVVSVGFGIFSNIYLNSNFKHNLRNFKNVIYGSSGDDNITSNHFEEIYTYGGDDTIIVNGKANIIDAGSGNDKVYIHGDAYKTVILGCNEYRNKSIDVLIVGDMQRSKRSISNKQRNMLDKTINEVNKRIRIKKRDMLNLKDGSRKNNIGGRIGRFVCKDGDDVAVIDGYTIGGVLGGKGNDFIYVGKKALRGIYGGDGDDIICVNDFFGYIMGGEGKDIVYVSDNLPTWRYKEIKAERVIKVHDISKIPECNYRRYIIYRGKAILSPKDMLLGDAGKLYTVNNKYVVESLNHYGYVFSGNKVLLNKGVYKAEFYIKITDLSKRGSLLNIGIFSWDYRQEGYYREIFSYDFADTTSYTKLSFKFKIDNDGTIISPYIFTPGIVKFYVREVKIYKINDILDYTLTGDTSYTYEESQLFHRIGKVITDLQATNKKAFLAKPSDGEGFLVFGPYSTDELVGNHRMVFRLKTSDNTNNNILARIEVFNVNGNGVNKIRYIKGTDFLTSNVYQDFYINYKVEPNSKLEFRVLYFPSGDLYFDDVTVYGPREDRTPAKIENITLSSDKLKSFDLLEISFDVTKDLLDNPEVKVGDKYARFEKKIGNRYYYSYQVNDHSDKPIVVNKAITISAVDIHNNVVFDNSKTVQITIDNTGYVYEVEDLPSNLGYDIEDLSASWHKARTTSGSRKGFIAFGPYDSILPSNRFYIAKFRLKTSDNTNSSVIATIDVVNTNGSIQRVSKQIRGIDFKESNKYQDFTLKFYRGDSGVQEYRVYFEGNGDITVDRVVIYPYVDSSLQESYESEDLYRVVGNVVEDPQASNGKAVYAKAGVDEQGVIQFGPYTTSLKNGIWYLAKFRLKTTDSTNTSKIGLIDVYDLKTGYRVFKEIRGIDFSGNNTYTDITLRFLKPESDNLEFRVFFYGVQDLRADKITVVEDTGSKLPSYESEDLPSLVGRIVYDPDASGRQARKFTASTDKPGTIQFGPYEATNLKNGGYYKAVFYLKTTDNNLRDYIGLIDVYNGDVGYRKLKQIRGVDFDSTGKYQKFEVIFEKPIGSDNMEYRVFAYGNDDIIVDKVEILAVDPSTIGILPSYESENLPTKIGYPISDSYASAGRALTYDRNQYPNGGDLQFGPYNVENINIGAKYKANFVLEVDNNQINDIVAYLKVYDYKTNQNLVLPLRGTDFNAAGVYQTFAIPFEAQDNTALEFKVSVTGKATVTVDKVYITD